MGVPGAAHGSGAQRLDPGRPKMTPRQLKTAKMSSKRRPRRPRMAQEASKTAQEASEKAQETHKTPSDGSQEAQIVGKTYGFSMIFTIRPHSATGAPRGPQETSRRPKMAPRRLQDCPR